MFDEDNVNKPYYSTVQSSSEGEISSDEESKGDVLQKVGVFEFS